MSKQHAPIVTKQCAYCGAMFKNNNKRKKYCSHDCYHKADKERQKQYAATHKKPPKPPRILVCAYCGDTFAALHGKKLFCSPSCRSKFKNAEARQRTAEKRARKAAQCEDVKARELTEANVETPIRNGRPSLTHPNYDIAPDGRTLVRRSRDKWGTTTRTEIRS